MIRQYHAHRRQGGDNPLGVGVIATGTIFYIQDDAWWRDRYRGRATYRNPWIVEAFLNGTLGAARRNQDTGGWDSLYVIGRSDMAVVRSLRDGRHRDVAVRTLILHDEHGLTREPSVYPTLPNPRLLGRSPPTTREPRCPHPPSPRPRSPRRQSTPLRTKDCKHAVIMNN